MNEIILRPKISQWIISIFPVVVMMLCVWVATFFVSVPYMDEVMFLLFVVFFIYLVYSYFEMLIFRKWTVTEKNIKLEHGIFFRQAEFLEVYRIVDFKEQQSFLQMVFGIKTVIIFSEDKTTPRLPVFGIGKRYDLIGVLAPIVKEQRKENRIYEIANR